MALNAIADFSVRGLEACYVPSTLVQVGWDVREGRGKHTERYAGQQNKFFIREDIDKVIIGYAALWKFTRRWQCWKILEGQTIFYEWTQGRRGMRGRFTEKIPNFQMKKKKSEGERWKWMKELRKRDGKGVMGEARKKRRMDAEECTKYGKGGTEEEDGSGNENVPVDGPGSLTYALAGLTLREEENEEEAKENPDVEVRREPSPNRSPEVENRPNSSPVCSTNSHSTVESADSLQEGAGMSANRDEYRRGN